MNPLENQVVPNESYKVYPFKWENYISQLTDFHECNEVAIKEKPLIKYLFHYLQHLKTETIIAEMRYIDKDFLLDYSGYYARCYYHYEKTCIRLHFFKDKFSEDDFEKFLRHGNRSHTTIKYSSLNESYNGFIVVKPLPRQIIGRTCLRTFEENNDHDRYYIKSGPYDVHLFGYRLTIDNSLPFQEQDKVAAACATVALWTAFNATSKLFQHMIPSPVEITQSATQYFNDKRSIPSSGLNYIQIMQAIKSLNMESYIIKMDNVRTLQQTIYSYIKGKIPCLLGLNLYKKGDDDSHNHDSYSYIGSHAVTVTGFGIHDKSTIKLEFPLISDKIDRIYVHDDGIGPFAKMELDGTRIIHHKRVNEG